MNIVSMAMQYLTPMLIDKLASSLGIQSPLVKSAIGAILPSILAGLTGVAAKPNGGRQISDILGKQSPNILGELGNIFGGPRQAEVAKSGTDTLRDLLGGSAISGLTSAVSKFTGANDSAIGSLMGLAAPVVLGTLAQQQKQSNLDAGGIASLLMGQKDNIAAAMPAGFGDLLKGTGLLDSITPKAAAQPQPQQAPRPASSVSTPQVTPKPAGGMGMWPLVLGALAIAIGGWYYLGGGKSTTALPTAPAITLGNQNIGAQLGSAVEGLRGTLANVKDEASAKAALPRLQEMEKQFGTLREQSGRLPADGKKSLASYVAQILPFLRPVIDKALAAAGVGPIVKPVVDQILNHLNTMSKA